METDWILDVLVDVIAFAKINNIPNLADQLDAVLIVAMAEMEKAPPTDEALH